MVSKMKEMVPQKLKNQGHYARAQFFHYYYGRPSKNTNIIGVTGTDGKTTTCTIIYEILKHAGYPTGLITTISAKIGNKEYPTGFHVTSPSPGALQKFLKEMVDEGIKYVILETTSHALDQHRIGGLSYHSATFTNVSHEHLDYHKTYDEYLKTKARLIKRVSPDGFTVINKDDKSFDYLNKVSKARHVKTYTYGFSDDSDLYATNYENETGLTQFQVNYDKHNFEVEMHLPGEYNVYNALGAIQVALELGVDQEAIKEAIIGIKSLEGRWEVIQTKPFKVIIDFAHTPNSLEKVLEYARQDNPNGTLHVVFGSAGKRDFEKRPLMGRAAAIYADRIYLTAEDPRGETVENINRQIAIGAKDLGKVENKDYFSIPDRKSAIAAAISAAKVGDTILITGKGHEKSINIDGHSEAPWSDQEVTSELLTKIKK
jgi:UDP-N-acetylmuramoyl-L-alanyl-D-glutamate--2,6-diaminopimelate ligase